MRSLLLGLLLLLSPTFASAQEWIWLGDPWQSGCCSSHGGVGGCQSNGHALCRDGWTGSSCGCSYSPGPTSTGSSGSGGSSGGGSSRPSPTPTPRPKGPNLAALEGLYQGNTNFRHIATDDPLYTPLVAKGKDFYKVRIFRLGGNRVRVSVLKPFRHTFRAVVTRLNSFEVSGDPEDASASTRGVACSQEVTLTFYGWTSSLVKLSALRSVDCSPQYSTSLDSVGALKKVTG